MKHIYSDMCPRPEPVSQPSAPVPVKKKTDNKTSLSLGHSSSHKSCNTKPLQKPTATDNKSPQKPTATPSTAPAKYRGPSSSSARQQVPDSRRNRNTRQLPKFGWLTGFEYEDSVFQRFNVPPTYEITYLDDRSRRLKMFFADLLAATPDFPMIWAPIFARGYENYYPDLSADFESPIDRLKPPVFKLRDAAIHDDNFLWYIHKNLYFAKLDRMENVYLVFLRIWCGMDREIQQIVRRPIDGDSFASYASLLNECAPAVFTAANRRRTLRTHRQA